MGAAIGGHNVKFVRLVLAGNNYSYCRIIGWGWMYLSTVLGDYSRYTISWKLCSTTRAEDVTDTLDMALAPSGCDQAHVRHKLRLLSDMAELHRRRTAEYSRPSA